MDAFDTQGRPTSKAGTSFAVPIILSKMAYLSKLYQLENGRWPTEAERYQLLIDRCIDLGDGGRDPVYGFGGPDLSSVKNREATNQEGIPTGTNTTLCPCIDMGADAPPAGEPVPDTEPEYPRLCEYGGDTFANLRYGPGTEHIKIGTFAKGQQAILLAKTEGWAEIVTHKTTPMQRGWVTAKYVR